jgi:hypothetical protein
MSKLDKFLELPRRFDRWLKKAIGEGNELLYHFVRLLLIAIVFALVVAIVVEIALAVFRAISIVVAALIVALPYLLAIAIIAGIVAIVYFYRKRSGRLKKSETPSHVDEQDLQPIKVRATQSDDPDMRRSLLAADQQTRSALQIVLTSLQRFDHRLEMIITHVHYTDLFGDNWAIVRQFVESPQGKGVPDVSAALVEIIILYKRAQEARWVPINHDRIHAWWAEAARRRKWLSEVFESTAAAATAGVLKESGSGASVDAPSPDAAKAISSKPGVPPTLDDLLQYYEQMNQGRPTSP